jgi:Asp-tRNA(Asn)/Glu-tRNA(Gln) amidotransferase A subunit family amidase
MNPLGARPLQPLGEGPVQGRPALDATLMVLGSLTGLPAVTVPCGFTRSGLPVGLAFAGAAMRDGRVLELGHAYQRATRWHLEQPAALEAALAGERSR